MKCHLLFIILVTPIFFYIACGSTKNEQFSGLFGGEVTSTNGGSSTGGTTTGGTGGSSTSSSQIPTTTGGYITLSKIESILLGTNDTFKGISSEVNGDILLFVKSDKGSGIIKYEVWKAPINTNTVSTVCSLLNDNHFFGGIAIDDNYYFTMMFTIRKGLFL